jgi:RNA-directed DNA polymerase
MSDKSLADLSAMFNPILRGWQQYYGRFRGSALKPVWRSMNQFLIRWLMRKHKHLAGHKTRAAEMLGRLALGHPDAFMHWSLGYESWLRKSEQGDKWIFCLTAARIAAYQERQ